MSKKYIQSIEDIQRIVNQGQNISFSDVENLTFRVATSKKSGGQPRGGEITSFALSDKGRQADEALSHMQEQWWLSKLTKRQREVVKVLREERKRRDAANRLGVCVMAVNRIILRIRERIQMWEAMSDVA